MALDFKLPDPVAGWRNSSTLRRTVGDVEAVFLSWWCGFSAGAGSVWSAGGPALIGLGAGLIAGAGCIVLACRVLKITIAFPQQLLDSAAKSEVDKNG